MIDFTNCEKKNKMYGGANGSKIAIVYDGDVYMLKFPPPANKNDDLKYSNSCITEYLGCHILQSLGIQTQDTLLGTYDVNDVKKVVVACKDFAINGWTIQDFASLKNQIVDSERNGYGTELDEMIHTIYEQNSVEAGVLNDFFWDLFIADALIANWDRHNGNWGFLYNGITDAIKIAPVWDCGSTLYPQSNVNDKKFILHNKNEMSYRIYEIPTSALKLNGKRIKYFDFISSGKYPECTKALARMYPKINLDKINQIIDNTEYITDEEKEFYKTMIRMRKERILDFSYEKLVQPYIKNIESSQKNAKKETPNMQVDYRNLHIKKERQEKQKLVAIQDGVDEN
ncbi:MAG: HipA domain-containing protein [Holdemanella sp.]|nr:HipA domain-containing protein [Holdemanella sp.]